MKRKIIAVSLGLLVIIVGIILVSFISFIYLTGIARSLGLSEFKTAINNPPYIYVSWIIRAADALIVILGGFIAGRLVKEKGWLYGGLSGLIYFLLFLLADIFATLSLGRSYALNSYLTALPSGLILTIEAGIGGLISERFFKSKS